VHHVQAEGDEELRARVDGILVHHVVHALEHHRLHQEVTEETAHTICKMGGPEAPLLFLECNERAQRKSGAGGTSREVQGAASTTVCTPQEVTKKTAHAISDMGGLGTPLLFLQGNERAHSKPGAGGTSREVQGAID